MRPEPQPQPGLRTVVLTEAERTEHEEAGQTRLEEQAGLRAKEEYHRQVETHKNELHLRLREMLRKMGTYRLHPRRS